MLTGFILYYYGVIPNQPRPPSPGMRVEELLGKEFGLFTTLPGSSLEYYESNHKDLQAHNQGNYRTNKSYGVVRSFYLEQASKNGWTFVREEHFKSRFIDHIMFQKDGAPKFNYQSNNYSFKHELHIYYSFDEGLFTVGLSSRGNKVIGK